jgi:hypothetical protein
MDEMSDKGISCKPQWRHKGTGYVPCHSIATPSNVALV